MISLKKWHLKNKNTKFSSHVIYGFINFDHDLGYISLTFDALQILFCLVMFSFCFVN
jgi:hypothetical protein